jgi:hypothetical protein
MPLKMARHFANRVDVLRRPGLRFVFNSASVRSDVSVLNAGRSP